MQDRMVGELRVLQKLNTHEFEFEADILRDGPVQGGAWDFRNLETYYKTFAGRPVLIAYVGEMVGDGHNSQERIDRETGERYTSYMAPTAERIVGIISEDEDDLSLIERDGHTWVRVKGRIWSYYAPELVEKLIRTGRMDVSVETNILEMREEDGVEVFERWEGMGLTVLGDHVDPAVPGANIRALAALQQDFETMKLRVAALREAEDKPPAADQNEKAKNPKNAYKGVKRRMNKTLEKELAAKFPEHIVLGASDDGLNVALLSKNSTETFCYSFAPEDKGAVLPERMKAVNLSAAMPVGDEVTVDIDFQRLMEQTCAESERLAKENQELKERCEKMEAEAKASLARETARRIKVSVAAAVAKLAEINANRAEADRFDAAIIDEIKKCAENGDYVNCEAEDGEWCGEAKVKDAVSCACMNKQEEMDKAKAETARNASCRKYAFEPDFTGANEEGGLAGLYASMVNN